MRSRLWLVIVVLSMLIAPCRAYANEVDYIGSFGSGFNDLVRNEDDTNAELERHEEPRSLRANDDEEEGAAGLVMNWLTSLRIPLGANRYAPTSWYRYIVFVLRDIDAGRMGMVLIAVPIVFGWWGVRKCIRMIFRAFRKGKINA